MVDLNVDDMAGKDAGYWAELNKIRLQAGMFTFKGFEYQVEPMSSKSRRLCYLKARQSFGATINEVLKDLHGMIVGKYKLGVAHIFPTNDEVGEFSKSIFKPLITANKKAIGNYVKNVAGATDTTTLKRVNDAMLWLRGARLGQKVGDSEESTSSKTAGFSVDKCVFDEVDFMDPEAIVKYIYSMGQSPHQHEVYLGNPSHEDFGIHLIFQQSDQRYWFRKCSCSGLISTKTATTVRGNWTCAEKSFPQCVKIRSNGTGYVGCDKCGKEVPVWSGSGTGQWVPDYPEKSKYMHGYMASQLITPFNDPAEILEDFVNPPFGDLANIYRLRLGRPYSNKDEKLRKSDVLANCGNDVPAPRHDGPCAMGVDIGKFKHHLVIGIKTSNDRYEIIRACSVTSKQDIYDFAKRYNVKSDILDIGPEYNLVREYQKNSTHKTFLCQYSETQSEDAKFNENTGVVKVYRTGIFDRTHRLLTEGHIRLSCQCPETEEFARQCCNCARFEEKDKLRGIVNRYRPTGDRQEHIRNALNYFILAASGHRLGKVSQYETNRQTNAQINTKTNKRQLVSMQERGRK